MRRTWIALCLVLLAVTAAGYGQTGLGTIAGKVADASGGVLPGAEVMATNIETDVKTQTITNDVGDYLVPNLIPGKYTLTVSMTGFSTLQREGLTVQVGDRITLDCTLAVGEVSQTINVTGEAPLLRKADTETGEVITNTMLQNLPQLNRDPLQLLVLSGNVQGSGGRADDKEQDTRINGGRNQSIDYLVDGISAVTGRAHNIGGIVPSMDGFGEFKVITNPVAAEYGRVSGGLVTVVTKSGTNEYHGQIFDYNQNTILNANSWEQNRLGGERTVFNQNQFGFAIGGPVWLPKIYDGRKKTFFFFNYDGLRFRQGGELVQGDSPTEKMRAGDFTGTQFNGVAPAIYEPTLLDPNRYDAETGNWYRTIPMGGDGLHVPSNRIHPMATALLKYFPLPNREANANCSWCGNYVGQRNTRQDNDAFSIRLDQVLTEKQSIYGRFTRNNYDRTQTAWYGLASPSPSTALDGQWGTTINYVYALSPTTVLDARVGGHYNPVRNGNTLSPEFDNSDLPFDAITKAMLGGTNTLPQYIVASGGQGNIGNDNFTFNPSTAFEAAFSLSKIMSRHTLKFGYEHRRWYDNQYQSPSGQFYVLGNATTVTSAIKEWTDQGQANAWPTFMLGISGRSTLRGFITRALNMNYHAGYFMDDFKVNNKLTVNFGVRWEMETPTTDRFDQLVVWDKDLPTPVSLKPGFSFNNLIDQYFPTTGDSATDQTRSDNAAIKARPPAWVKNGLPNGGLAFVNTPEHPSRLSSDYHPWQFAPRLGAAYSVSDKTVVRASFAMMYLPTTGDPNAFGRTTDQWNMTDGTADVWADHDPKYAVNQYWTSTFDNPWPNTPLNKFQRTTAFANHSNTAQPSLGAIDSRMRQGRELFWNIGVQKELPGNLVVEVAYAGNRGIGLLGREMISRVPKDILTGGLTGDNKRRYSTEVAIPFAAGQTRWADDDEITLGNLMTEYPFFGTVATAGRNIGTSKYHALNLRADKRFSHGASFLFNYTLSNLKDDVGGPGNNDPNAKFYSGGGKWVQSVDDTRDNWGTSIWDEKHRLTTTFDVELPFGKNRPWLSGAHPVLDGIVGGWIVAGNAMWRSGRPLVWPQSTLQNAYVRAIEIVGVSWADAADQELKTPSISGWSDVFVPPGSTPALGKGILDVSKLYYDPVARSYGFNPWGPGHMTSYDGVRHPGITRIDLSLMKRFPIFSDGERYLQFRMEAQNVFNMHGFGDINTNPQSGLFGYITGVRNDPRRIQMSMKFAF